MGIREWRRSALSLVHSLHNWTRRPRLHAKWTARLWLPEHKPQQQRRKSVSHTDVREIDKTPLGSQGAFVSRVGLGCLSMSEMYGEPNDEESLATILRALDLGINFLDTADIYGLGHN